LLLKPINLFFKVFNDDQVIDVEHDNQDFPILMPIIQVGIYYASNHVKMFEKIIDFLVPSSKVKADIMFC
jgi:hypothetical protein